MAIDLGTAYYQAIGRRGGLVTAARNRSKTECPAGHPYTAENTYVDPRTGFRKCRACQAARLRVLGQKRRQRRGE